MDVVQELAGISIETEVEDFDDATKAALGHIARFLAHSATQRNKCEACSNLLVDRVSAPLNVQLEDNPDKQLDDVNRSFTKLLNRGKLVTPSSTAIAVTTNICHIWRCLITNDSNRSKLMNSALPGGYLLS